VVRTGFGVVLLGLALCFVALEAQFVVQSGAGWRIQPLLTDTSLMMWQWCWAFWHARQGSVERTEGLLMVQGGCAAIFQVSGHVLGVAEVGELGSSSMTS
jgi:hypothetical protein